MADPDASICDFASNLLLRAKVRKEVVVGNLPRGIQITEPRSSSAPLRTVAPTAPVLTPIPQTCLKEVQAPNILTSPDQTPPPRAEEDDVIKNTKSGGRSTRLKSLARKINAWEDDMTHYVPPTSRFNISPPKNSPRRSSAISHSPSLAAAKKSPTRFPPVSSSPSSATSPKHVRFDPVSAPRPPSPQKQLPEATFSPKQSQKVASPAKQAPIPKVVTTLSKPVTLPDLQKEGAPKVTPAATTVANTSGGHKFKVPASVGKKKDEAKGAKPQLNSTMTTVAGLSVAQRAKMFEQQSNGNVPKPYRPPSRQFAHGKRMNPLPGRLGVHTPVSKSHDISISIPRGKVENQRRRFEGGQEDDLDEMEEEEGSCGDLDGSTDSSPPPPAFVPPPPPPPQQKPMEVDLSLTFSALTEDDEVGSGSSPPRMDTLAVPGKSTTPKRLATSPSRSRSTSPDKKNYPGARDVKRIRVNEPKPGRIYPSLTDIESQTETEVEEPETEEEESAEEPTIVAAGVSECSSLGAQVVRMAKANNRLEEDESPQNASQTPSRRIRNFRPTENFSPLSASTACREIDAMIDDALEGQSFTMDTVVEGELSSANASSAPVSANVLEEPSWSARVTAEALGTGTIEEDDEESTLQALKGGTSLEHPSDYKVEANEPGFCDSMLFVDARHDLDTNTPNKDSSPLDTSSPLYPKWRGDQSPSTPLLHSVSFFRKQQEEMYVTPRKAVQDLDKLRKQQEEEEDDDEYAPPVDPRVARADAINDVIRKLEEEHAAQLRSIGQVSKALTLCKSTVEFSESTENVECEKVLLIACQKRNAILNEITRLRTEGALSSAPFFTASKIDLGPSCQGKLSISELRVELKPDFIRNKVLQGGSLYHFLVLLKERQHVESSSLVSIGHGRNNSRVLDSDGCIHFPNTFTLEHLDPGFKAELEVFVLQTQQEFLPHEAKYHIFKKALTPKKLKAESKFSRSAQPSPAGPDAIRTPNFNICGRLTINISTLGGRGHGGFWNLDGVRFESPVEGSISLKMECSAEGGEEKSGFLTFFDDISGMGAWIRRWTKLTANFLTYWTYPEDEQEGRFPMGQITLRNCVTTRVCPVQRDVCARANTFLLVTTRDPLPTDKDSLVTSCHNNKTAIRHLMSADTREERDAWCANMNRALANIRAWDPDAASPDDTLF